MREIRIDKHLTQEYVAYAANVNTSHISNIENNKRVVTDFGIAGFCQALHCTEKDLLLEFYEVLKG